MKTGGFYLNAQQRNRSRSSRRKWTRQIEISRKVWSRTSLTRWPATGDFFSTPPLSRNIWTTLRTGTNIGGAIGYVVYSHTHLLPDPPPCHLALGLCWRRDKMPSTFTLSGLFLKMSEGSLTKPFLSGWPARDGSYSYLLSPNGLGSFSLTSLDHASRSES